LYLLLFDHLSNPAGLWPHNPRGLLLFSIPMPTAQRVFSDGEYYHIYNRGVLKSTIFHDDQDYNRFMNTIQKYKEEFPVKILAYAVLPNHFHFLLGEPEWGDQPRGFVEQVTRGVISHFMHRLCTSYAKYYQTRYSKTHSGVVFQGRFKSKYIDSDAYLLQLLHYIHSQPVHHQLAQKNLEWSYTSLWEYYHAQKSLFRLVDDDTAIDKDSYSSSFSAYVFHPTGDEEFEEE